MFTYLQSIKIIRKEIKYEEIANLQIFRFDYIYFYSQTDELEKELPYDLINCLGFAQKHNCYWLMLDCDAEVIDELEIYEW